MRILAGILLGLSIGAAQTRLGYVDLGAWAEACCMAMDGDGNLYVAGSANHTSSANSAAVESDLVITKLDRDLNVVYRFAFGIRENTGLSGIAVDGQGNVVVAGSTSDPNFPLKNPLATKGTGFVSKLNAAGTQLLFSTLFTGYVNAVTLDTAGNIYVTGSTNDANFPVTANAYQRDGPAATGLETTPSYAFVSKLTAAGDHFVFSTFFGARHANCAGSASGCVGVTASTDGKAIAVGADGTVTVAGFTSADQLPTTPGAFQSVCNCSNPGGTFVSRFSSDGSKLLWSTFLGHYASFWPTVYGETEIRDIALTPDGGVVVAGTTSSDLFPVTPGAFQSRYPPKVNPNQTALFVTRFNSSGTALVFSTYLGGSAVENVYGLALDPAGNVWLTGLTNSPDFPVLPNSLAMGGAFITELAADGARLLVTERLPGGSGGQDILLDNAGNQILLGQGGSVLRFPISGPAGTTVLAQTNAAGGTYSENVAPGELMTFYGTGLGPANGVSGQPNGAGRFDSPLAGTQVLFDGIPAPLLYVTENQINLVAPFELSGKTTTSVLVQSTAGVAAPLMLHVAAANPAVFGVPNPVTGGQTATTIIQNGTVTFWMSGAGVLAIPYLDGSVVQAALPVPELPVSAIVDNYAAAVISATAAPGAVAGLLQVTLQIPAQVLGNFHLINVRVGETTAGPVSFPWP